MKNIIDFPAEKYKAEPYQMILPRVGSPLLLLHHVYAAWTVEKP